MKRLFAVTGIILALSLNSGVVFAQENCVEQYGGGRVCGVSTPPTPHQPVKAGLADINPVVLSFASLASAGVLLLVAKVKDRKQTI